MFWNRSGAALLALASFVHEILAELAVLAIAVLFLIQWRNEESLRHPYEALLIAVVMVVGSILDRASLRRMEKVVGDNDVSELLSEAYRSGSLDEDDTYRRRGTFSQLLSAVMPFQIVATAVLALALITAIQNMRTEENLWPAIAAIGLSELMYFGSMLEGEAVADELVVVSRRWVRRRDARAAAPQPLTELPPAPTPAAAEPVRPPIRRVRYLCELLALAWIWSRWMLRIKTRRF
jgi:hypothetical protein